MSAASRHSKTSGIDFRQALEILSLRAAESTSSHDDHNENRPDGRPLHAGSSAISSCPCCRQPSIPESVTQLGQVIDLHPDSSNGSDASSIPGEDELRRQTQELDATRSRRRQEMLAEIQEMSVLALLRAVVAAQQQRVAAYKSYDRGLETVLHTRNLALYPAMVADATASFAVLSDTINAIQLQLEPRPAGDVDDSLQSHRCHNRPDLKTIVHRLQMAEQQKLSLTAALHLEQIRLQGAGSPEASDDDAATASRLLEEGVQTLRSKVSACADSINEIMDELQGAMVEEEEGAGME